jgi:hypothetical protein
MMGGKNYNNIWGGKIFMGTGFGFGLTIPFILTFFIKLLFIVFIIGLVGGLLVTVKNFVFTPEDIENFKAPFKGCCKTIAVKATCPVCGKEVKEDWRACPHCSTSLEK